MRVKVYVFEQSLVELFEKKKNHIALCRKKIHINRQK